MLKRLILKKFENSHIMEQRRAAALLYFYIIVIGLLFCAGLFTAVLNPSSAVRVISGVSTIAGFIILGISRLKAGNFRQAVNFFLIPTVIQVIMIRFYIGFNFPASGFTSYIYYFLFVIAFAATFSKKISVPLISVLFFVSNIIFYLVVSKGLKDVLLQISTDGIIHSSAAMIVIALVCYIQINLSQAFMENLKDESNLNKTQLEKIKYLFSSIKNSTQRLKDASEKFSVTSQSISSGAREQSAVLEESSAAMEEMTATISMISDDITKQAKTIDDVDKSVNNLSELIAQVASHAEHIMKESNRSIREGDNAASNSSLAMDGIKRIQQSSEKIRDIILLISKLADQTNLLALNAAIESARAGDAGYGFAVVADEISKLAENSTSSAREISDLINETSSVIAQNYDFFSGFEKQIHDMRDTLRNTANLSKQMNEAAHNQLGFSNNVKSSMNMINSVVSKIADATKEQTQTSLTLSRSLESASEITQSYAINAEDLNTITQELKNITKVLNEEMK
ncbi:MAG TPA: methyl-accepting chemotaxis protein [Spirochaetota bacterium]|nr:methyl-accepting chemotaxis protein [Spirochaetota bacterium]